MSLSNNNFVERKQRSSTLLPFPDEREHFLCALEEEYSEKFAQNEHNEVKSETEGLDRVQHTETRS